MSEPDPDAAPADDPAVLTGVGHPDHPWRKPPRRTHHAVGLMTLALLCYVGIAYGAMPELWKHYEHQKKLAGLPMLTMTSVGLPGDPINLAFVGDKRDIVCAMEAIGWYPADPVTLRSSIEISGSVLLDRPYRTAPVSPLYYEGRSQDLAFEKPEGRSADRRHHVRFWEVLKTGEQNRPVWLAAATYDRGIRLSRYTGAVTHRIGPDIDAERRLIATSLEEAHLLAARYTITGIGPTLLARNGGGDLYFTDGEVWVLELVQACQRRSAPPARPDTPLISRFKDQLFEQIAVAIDKETN